MLTLLISLKVKLMSSKISIKIWDAFKCTITGYCIQYCSRTKLDREKVKKKDLFDEIEKVKVKIPACDTDDGSDNEVSDLIATLSSLEKNIIQFLTMKLLAQLFALK